MVVHRMALMCLVAFASIARADSLWDHNGSIVRLVADGSHRTFLYEVPREGLQRAGVSKGTILFEGVRDGQRYKGTARRFSRNCAEPLQYSVSGAVETETRIVLRGQREVFDSACHATGEVRNDTLVFTYLRDAGGGSRKTYLPDAFRGTWTSRPGDCTTDIEVPDSAQVMTIDTQITTWKIYPPQSEDEDAYDWCDVRNIRKIGDGQVIVDVDCAHPGHSRRDVVLRMSTPGRINMGGMEFVRCD